MAPLPKRARVERDRGSRDRRAGRAERDTFPREARHHRSVPALRRAHRCEQRLPRALRELRALARQRSRARCLARAHRRRRDPCPEDERHRSSRAPRRAGQVGCARRLRRLRDAKPARVAFAGDARGVGRRTSGDRRRPLAGACRDGSPRRRGSRVPRPSRVRRDLRALDRRSRTR